jgi:NAD(P)H-dependent FMN reductase
VTPTEHATPAAPLTIVVILGTVRSERQGIKAARFVVRTMTARGHDVTLVDPLVEQLPLLDRMYKEYPAGTAPAVLERLAALYRSADAFIIVSGEYNHSIPPALSNLLDHFLEEYFFRPSAIVCYSGGAWGGVRAMVQLRATLAELGMPSISSHFPIPRVQDAFDDDGMPKEAWIEERFPRFASELEWYAEALRVARGKGTPY